jgi:hypothetical protein
MVEPTHTLRGPGNAGAAFMVTTTDLVQALVAVYTMLDVPAARPVTTPVALIVPAAGLLLLHVPPGVVLARVVVAPTTVCAPPVIALGNARTVTGSSLARTYLIGDITVPAATPVIMPVAAAAEAIAALLLLHVPPPVALLNEVVVLTHTDCCTAKGSRRSIDSSNYSTGASCCHIGINNVSIARSLPPVTVPVLPTVATPVWRCSMSRPPGCLKALLSRRYTPMAYLLLPVMHLR